MKGTELLRYCTTCLPRFGKVAGRIEHEPKGIFPSEALLIISLAHGLNVSRLVESGRARGYSTRLFAEYFKDDADFEIVSIDYDRHSNDADYSAAQLKTYAHVSLVYGDATQILPEYTTDDCVVFIDGPKGDDALLLAADALRRPHVKAVCVHDLHRNTFYRTIFETIFTDTFFSDDDRFVKAVGFLDELAFLRIVTDPAGQPVFVHCREGEDRTGMMVAVYRMVVQDWPKGKAMAEMKRMGFNEVWEPLEDYLEDFDPAKMKRQLHSNTAH